MRGSKIISDVCAFSSKDQEAHDLARKAKSFGLLSDLLCFQGDASRGEGREELPLSSLLTKST